MKKLLLCVVLATICFACKNGQNEPDNKQVYQEGQVVTFQVKMGNCDGNANNGPARYINGTVKGEGTKTPKSIRFVWDKSDVLTILDKETNKTSTFTVQGLSNNDSTAAFTGSMPSGWEVGHRFIAICGPDDIPQKVHTTVKDVINKDEMRFVSNEYTDIPEEITMNAAWAAIRVEIGFTFMKNNEATDPAMPGSGYNFNIGFAIDSVDILNSSGNLLYRYYLTLQGIANYESQTNMAPCLFVVKNGDYSNFKLKVYLKMSSDQFKVKDINPSGGDVSVGDGYTIQRVYTYPTSLTLNPSYFLAAQSAIVTPRITWK